MDNNEATTLVGQFDALVYELMQRISNLNTASRDRLLEKARHIHLEPNRQLAAEDWAWSLLYLVEGSLIREVPGRTKEVLVAGHAGVDQPIFPHIGPSHATVTARVPSEVLAFDRQLFELLQEEEQEQIKEIAIVDMDAVESALFQRFTSDHHHGRLEIPGVPEVAERIVKLVDGGDHGEVELAHLVALDPALAARVARAVGNDLRHGGIEWAVQQLGRDNVREIIFDYGESSGCRNHSSLLREEMLKAHRHSVHVAAYCYVLAQGFKGLNPDHALLCGLFHEVGMFPLLCAADEYTDRIGGADGLNAMVWKLRGMIGGLVLGGWGFDNEIVAMAEEAGDWRRDTADRAPDYTDVVLVAQLHSYIGTDRASKLPKFADVPAFRKIAGKESGPRFSFQVLQETSPRILAVEQLLEGIG